MAIPQIDDQGGDQQEAQQATGRIATQGHIYTTYGVQGVGITYEEKRCVTYQMLNAAYSTTRLTYPPGESENKLVAVTHLDIEDPDT